MRKITEASIVDGESLSRIDHLSSFNDIVLASAKEGETDLDVVQLGLVHGLEVGDLGPDPRQIMLDGIIGVPSDVLFWSTDEAGPDGVQNSRPARRS